MAWLDNVVSAVLGRLPPAANDTPPNAEAGASGTAIWGGYVENIERDPRLSGVNRYRTAGDILSNVSIVAAGLRFYLNLVASPTWVWEPAKDSADGKESSDAAKRAADFMQSVMDDMDTNWKRIVRRGGMYRFHGFGIHEWIAKVREQDGRIGLRDIESRPQHTIEQWYRDPSGRIEGMGQRDPQTGILLPIPRWKTLYLVDDSMTDSPEGMGFFRQLVDPAERIRRYQQLEGIGFDRDLRGLPIGRAPLAEINAAVKAGKLKAIERTQMLQGMRNFLAMKAKADNTSLLVDSSAYEGVTADGTTVSSTAKWGLDLVSTDANGFTELGLAIERLRYDMALIIGAEGLLLGSGATSGNRALGEDKSRNLYISVNQAVDDIAAGVYRDIVNAVWALNGFPDSLKPKPKPEDVAFKDAATIASTLRDMAAAGAVLAPDDPAIDDVRDLVGISRQPPDAVKRAMEMEQVGQEAARKALEEPPPPDGATQPPV